MMEIHPLAEGFRGIRYSLRQLRRRPTFTIVVLLTLALGIGGATTIFSVVDSVLLRPFPYPHAERLFQVMESNLKQHRVGWSFASGANYADWRRTTRSFEELAAVTLPQSVTFSSGGQSEQVNATYVSSNILAVFGNAIECGRAFLPQEEVAGQDQEAILSHSFWERVYGADPSIVGRPFKLNGKVYTVVGIMPKGFRLPLSWPQLDIYLPVALNTVEMSERGSHRLWVFGRLRSGVSQAQAQAEMDTVASGLLREYPESNAVWGGVQVQSLKAIVSDFQTTLWAFQGAVVLLFLIACINVANLQLTKSVAEKKEYAIRSALGATDSRLILQGLTGNLLLAVLGGILGLVLAIWAMHAFLLLGPPDITTIAGLKHAGISWQIVFFAVTATLLTLIITGIFPIFQSSQFRLTDSLRQGGRSYSSGGNQRRAARILVVCELACALAILSGAGLLAASLIHITRIPLGFAPQSLLTMEISFTGQSSSTTAELVPNYQTIIEKIHAISGIQEVAAASDLPFTGANMGYAYSVAGQPNTVSESQPMAEVHIVTTDYFRTMEIPLTRGRAFGDGDTANAPGVVIINRTLANRITENGDSIGTILDIKTGVKEIGKPSQVKQVVIVGVVADVKKFTAYETPHPAIYLPFRQNPQPSMFLAVRSPESPLELQSQIQTAIRSVQGDVPVFDVKTMDERMSTAISQQRFDLLLVGLFALIATALAMIGMYGTVSNTVAQRTHELGVRIALGARSPDIMILILKEAAVLVMLGTAGGLILFLIGGRILRGMIYGLSTYDPLVLTTISSLLAVTALFASYIPTRRAIHVDPIKVLKE